MSLSTYSGTSADEQKEKTHLTHQTYILTGKDTWHRQNTWAPWSRWASIKDLLEEPVRLRRPRAVEADPGKVQVRTPKKKVSLISCANSYYSVLSAITNSAFVLSTEIYVLPTGFHTMFPSRIYSLDACFTARWSTKVFSTHSNYFQLKWSSWSIIV